MEGPAFGGAAERAEDFYPSLVQDFEWGALAPNAHVDVAGIRAMYAVDDDLARAGMAHMVESGMAVRQPDGEVRIAPLDAESVDALIERCRQLSMTAIASASCRLSDVDDGKLVELLDSMDMVSASEDKIRLAELATQFHDIVYSASEDAEVLAEIQALNPLLVRFMGLVLTGKPTRMVDTMRAISDAVRARSKDAVTEAYESSWRGLEMAVASMPETVWPR